ncbi:MAG: DUF2959 family protein [Methylococcales bacterium]|nr:DUF2959 family protein [Methylococcales bacterium]
MPFLKTLLLRHWRGFYYRLREHFGEHKRDLVIHHVEQACTGLSETKVHFQQALQRFQTIVSQEATPLSHKYRLLSQQYVFCQARADALGHRIDNIESVTDALFREWNEELESYRNKRLKALSRAQLKQSSRYYQKLLKALRRAQSQMTPVLASFRDQVLFLKHNLNAQAIAALEQEFIVLSVDIAKLIDVMEQSIAEANEFMDALIDTKALPSPNRQD